MLGFFHFNPLQARLNKVKGEKHRTVKPSGFDLFSEKTFLVHEILQSWAPIKSLLTQTFFCGNDESLLLSVSVKKKDVRQRS
jgi:hypothetical protein